MQKVYLSNIELSEAVALYLNKLGPIRTETEWVHTADTLGRISAAPVYAKLSSPFYNSSAMDGIATLSTKTYGAGDRNHIQLEKDLDYVVVDTGDPIPREYDCVIMVEDLIHVDENHVAIYSGATPWQNIRPLGEDIVENQLIIPSAHEIRPVDIGAMLAGGCNEVQVYCKPLVGIIPTGTEMVEPGSELKIGDIIEFNSRVFSAQVTQWGAIPKRYDIIKDDYELIKACVKQASEECDIVLINAGSSAGREDFTWSVVSELGEVYVHGVAIKPGKPVILGSVAGKPVVGIPGFPVSAYFVMENICKPVVMAGLGKEPRLPKSVNAVLSRRVMSSLKYLEFVRMKLGFVDGRIVATPISRGAGATMSLVRADGVLEVPQSIEGYEAGTVVEVKLMKDEDEIMNTIVCIGSHDPIVDVAADLLNLTSKKFHLSSAHVGSMGGIMALLSGETHIAPIHLLDLDTGEYNRSYIKKYLGGKDIALIKGVRRIQGLMTAKGNPMGLRSITDVADASKQVRYVNRQKGSGTRLFLDYQLGLHGIHPEKINGYEREEFTHLSVAAAIAAGDADVGIGVYSAAMMLGLDFIPLGNEEYDFAVPMAYLALDMVKAFIEVLQSETFLTELDRLGGYDYTDTGKIIID